MVDLINVNAMQLTSAPIRAAQYLRKSSHHQEFSTELQSAANHAYAASRGMRIVRSYTDEGKSGLTIDGRAALRELLDDVQSGTADFTAILVYDVSRWGRFQDIDESGYYEHICKRAGIRVYYCVEQFVNDGSPFSVIIKNIKRAMASEYSRELSEKVFAAHARLVTYG
jgi:DNA invertase Pin-like site-specific DNA recombinase